MDRETLLELEHRLGRLHARQRLGLEIDHEARILAQGINFFHAENWYSIHSLTRGALKLARLYARGRRNTECIRVRHNEFTFKGLPSSFDGFAVLHISDLHADMNEGAMRRLIELVGGLRYDVCVLTGDYRGKTFGPFEAALAAVGVFLKFGAGSWWAAGAHALVGVRRQLSRTSPVSASSVD